MLRIFNKSFSQGKLPSPWKHAILVPIPKPHSDVYRPITLLSCISKVIEILILNRLHFCAKPLSKNSMGFKKESGTIDAVATLVEDLTSRRDKGSTAFFIDLEKAFELSNPLIMLTSFVNSGVKGNLVKWLKDFLTDRKATLTFQGAKPHKANFDNGTPQGSTLSPTLFNYLLDQLHSIILPRGVKMLTYADDIVIYKTNDRRETGYYLQKALNLIVDKISSIGLKVSEVKTKSLFIHSAGRQSTFDLFINGLPIEWVKQFKYLGVHIDNTLSFARHARHVTDKAYLYKRINAMKVMSNLSGVNMSVLKQIYISTVRPILEYGF